MIFETPDGEVWLLEDVAREAVKQNCDKFRYGNEIYQINFSYRKIEKVEMTEEEAVRQFGDK